LIKSGKNASMHHPSISPAGLYGRGLMRPRRQGRLVFALAAAVLVAATGLAEARSKGSMGSRGSRTQDAPAATQTAPSPAQPIQRTQTPANQTQAGPAASAAQAAQPARSRFGGGFFAGLLGAGLLGALFGAGLFGGLGSLASILGLLLQVGLLVGLVVLAVRFFRRRQQPAMAPAGAPAPMHRSSYDGALPAGGSAVPASGLAGGGLAAPRPRTEPITLKEGDFADFEATLDRVQTAYGREDVAALWELATPEMAGYYQEEINENARKGVRGTISAVKLLQGDLSEAWREGVTEYATVAMRYAITEQVVDRASGAVISGGPDEATEVWTFRRDQGGPWKVSAVQQTA
jgi:predicted lipid-binding transport protein (Tim44 family)